MRDPLTIPARQERVRAFLDRLGATPPQVLLLEGGHDPEREALALYWACLLNCARSLACKSDQPVQTALLAPAGQPKVEPCGACPECVQILEQVHRDLVFIDGRTESIKIDMVRELRSLMGEPPRGQGKRVIVLFEAQALQPEAANFLLKSMEEPRPGNVFVLTAPQRERLLPTLVSRSFVLTLAWPEVWEAEPVVGEGENASEWAGAMGEFWRTGRGWFERASDKGRLDAPLAARVLVECQRALAGALSGREEFGQSLRGLGPESLRRLDAALDMAQECLEYRVNPALTLDWLAVTGFSLTRGQ
ncbi:DNA polymerase III, delta prime subunit [Desulfocurvibacter africanus]|uniref:DNA polymerase III, delta prime subunit, putative n=1 Tax=Desulfocurvibacter africanus subsp. africanus str. Walvis Bay TaxID=690850 RepID=F3YVM3_DESAF|nr:DNA polymerase III, delta prime subunit [Desulfocurvibacter africanus]EGJ48759.1 DNA polymerase III, delta prime subunit, putative [Desulfocurvibacter africanus subsp. africanus str. Walvis Bay]